MFRIPSTGMKWDRPGCQALAGRDHLSPCLSRLEPGVPIHPGLSHSTPVEGNNFERRINCPVSLPV